MAQDGKLVHPPHGEYHRDEDDVDDDDDDDGLGNGEEGEDDGDDGIRWRGGQEEELQNESDSLHRWPDC